MTERNVLEKFDEDTRHPGNVQRELILSIIRTYRDTAYGSKYDFGQISSEKDYKKRVPLTTFEDYDEIECPDTEYYAMTSGSTGDNKLIPVSKKGIRDFYMYAHVLIEEMISSYYSELTDKQVHGKIFHIGEFRVNGIKNGIPYGIRTSGTFFWLKKTGEFDQTKYTSPNEVLFPENNTDMIYAKARFAMAERKVTGIWSVFVHRVVGMFSYILENWDILVDDIENGTLNYERLPDRSTLEKLRTYISPMPERAAELRQIKEQGRAEGLIKKLWPDIKFVVAIDGNAFSVYEKEFMQYVGDVPVHYNMYAATEGILGIANFMNNENQYILLPDACYYEFIPVGADSDAGTFGICDIRPGVQYEIVITNSSGLFRYRVNDVIEVVGFYHDTPIINFCYRKNQLMNLAGEKTDGAQLRKAVEKYFVSRGLTIKEYCFYPDVSVHPARYVMLYEGMYAEEPAGPGIDECLCEYNSDYADCRANNELSEATVKILMPGTFIGYRDLLAKSGMEMGQNKPVVILKTQIQLNYFVEHILKG